jgi:uncharacterized protein (TIGR03437 family)
MCAAQNVFTGGYDTARTNANLTETTLTPSVVHPGAFGKLFSVSVDGQIYAQPLYQKGLVVAGKTHNVVFVATMHNSVYAFDADTPATPLWTVNLGPSVPTSNYLSDTGPYTDIVPENGILGTPVIDPATGTLYLVAATFESAKYIYRLHALDTATGKEKFGAPAVISATVPGTGDSSVAGKVPFVQNQHLQRTALLLANGLVYVGFGSHGDAVPFHGWVMAYNAAAVGTQAAVFNTSANGGGGSFWQSGRGLVSDEKGVVYAVASNGVTDQRLDFAESVLKLDPQKLSLMDWFAPFNYQSLNDTDDDLGSCGAIFIPGTNYLVTGGKQGVLYLMDRGNLGHTAANDAQIVQRLDTQTPGIYNMALWNRPDGPLLYLHTDNQPVTSYKLQNGHFLTTPAAKSVDGYNVGYQGMTLSANGYTPGTGILWMMVAYKYPLPSHGVLHAYNAETLSELWNSDQTETDAISDFVKFANPTVANGKVYVPTGLNELVVYGPNRGLNPNSAPIITGIVNAASYANGPLSPGEMVAVFGEFLGPDTLATGAFDSNSLYTKQVAATQVTFNGIPGPVLYTSAGAVAAIVPYEVTVPGTITVQVLYNGKSSAKINMSGVAAFPGLFSADATGFGPGAFLNSDLSLNSQGNPAKIGSIVVLYATGGGQTTPASATGSLTRQARPLSTPLTVTVGGKAATVLYAGAAGGEVAGAVQLNIQLPVGVSGSAPVVLTQGGRSSQATVTVAIH